MGKKEIVAAMAEEMGESKVSAEKGLNAFLKVIEDALAKGERVQLVGFGTFEIIDRPEREGTNPQTGKPMMFKASKSPRFKAGKTLKDRVNA